MRIPSSRFQRRFVGVFVALAIIAACSNGSDPKEATPSSGGGGEGTATTVAGGGGAAASGFNDAQFEGDPDDGGEIVFGVESTIATLDPAGNLAQPADIDMALAIYDQLIDYDDKGEPAPNLATEWTNSDDLKTWTLTLRDDVTFSDDTPFNAEAVVKHFTRLKDPATNCTCAPIVALIDSITATGEFEVEFKLTEPNAFFLTVLTGAVGFVASPTATEKFGPDYGRNPVGTGPFILESFDSLVLKKNPNYWKTDDEGRQLPYLDQITVKPIADATVRIQSLESGDIDAFQTADTATVADAVAGKEFKVQKVTGSSSTITIFNMRKPPFDDVRMRRAIAMGINRDELNNVLYKGARQLAYGPFALDSPFYAQDVDWPQYDPEAAKALVDEAKADGISVSFTTTCIATPEGRNGLAVTQRNGQAIGMDGTNEFLDQGAYVNKVIGPEHEFTIGCFRSPQIADADGLYNVLKTGGSGNVMGYSNATVDKALEDIRATADPEEHIRLLNIIQEQVAKDVPVVPLLYDLFANIYSPDISGFPKPQANYLGAIKFATLYRKAA